MPDTDLIRRAVLDLSPEVSADVAAEVFVKVEHLGEVYRDLKRQRDEFLMAWMDRNGDLQIGHVRYYKGTKSTTRCTDLRKAAEAVLEAVGGDLDSFCTALGSSAFKYGEVRRLVGDTKWRELFTVTVEPDLATGRPVREVKRVDERFAGSRG